MKIIDDIDKLYHFFKHRNNHFAMMHCVSIYPTPTEELNLSMIRLLKIN